MGPCREIESSITWSSSASVTSENLLRPSRAWSVTRLWIVERETFKTLAMRVQVNPSPLNSSKIAGGISKNGLPRPLLLQEGFPKSTALVFLLSVSANASCCHQYRWISQKHPPSLPGSGIQQMWDNRAKGCGYEPAYGSPRKGLIITE